MESELARIWGKISDYKLCSCGQINWYENEECRNCGSKNELTDNRQAILEWIEKEYEFWIKTEGYTEDEADEICYEV